MELMGKIVVYHGSADVIEEPVFGIGNPKNDYGLGFYCTGNLELAKEWACAHGRDGFANVYELETDTLRVMDLQSKEYHILNWLAILLKHRTFFLKGNMPAMAVDYILETFLPEFGQYDIIKGYRADDSYFSFAADFVNNAISLSQLAKAMRFGKLGEQIVLKSKRSFDALTFKGSLTVDGSTYFPKRILRDRAARKGFISLKNHLSPMDDYFVIDIIRGKWRNDDARLR